MHWVAHLTITNIVPDKGIFVLWVTFLFERSGKASASNDNGRKAPVPLVLSGLLNPKLASQVRVSREFSERHMYYERTLALLKGIERKLSLFQSFKGKKIISMAISSANTNHEPK